MKKKSSAGRKIIYTIAVLLAIACIGLSVYLYLTVNSWSIIPTKYMNIALYVLIGVNVFLALFTLLPKVSNLNKILGSVMTLLVCAALLVGSIYLPKYKGQFERAFTEVPTSGELNINVYSLKSSGITEVEQLAGQTIGTQASLDLDNQDYAIKVINREIKGEDIKTQPYDDIYKEFEALLNGTVNAVMINESYVPIIADNEDFVGLLDKINLVYKSTQIINLDYDTSAVSSVTTEPFMMIVAGRDSYSYSGISADSTGRSDSIMLLVCNPVNKQILVVTIPRDSYVPIKGVVGHEDKITHATVWGINALVKTVNSFLDVKINYFLRINFQSVIDVIDAMGGVTVQNPYYFCMTYKDNKAKNYCFDEGEVTLDGEHALGYVRERKYGNMSDLKRNAHQALVIKAMIDKVTSVDMITKIGDLLEALNGKFTTNMNVNDIYALAQMQLNDMADWELISYGLTGKTGYAKSYAMPSRELSMVFLNSDSVSKAKEMITAVMSTEGYHAAE